MTGEPPKLEPDLLTWEQEQARQGKVPGKRMEPPPYQPVTMRPGLAEEILARRQVMFPQIAGRFPHETEGYLKQRLQELTQESARRSQLFGMHLLAQGQLQGIEQERQAQEQDQQQEGDLQQLGLDLSAGMSELPQTLPDIEERLHEMGPRLRPQEYDQFLQRIERAKELHTIVSAARQAAQQAISESLGETLEAGQSPGRLLEIAGESALGGAEFEDAKTLRTNVVRSLLKKQRELEERFIIPSEEELGPRAPEDRANVERMMQEQLAPGSTEPFAKRREFNLKSPAGLEPDQAKALIAQTMSDALEEAMSEGLEEAGGLPDVAAKMGHLVGMLFPFAGGAKAGTAGVRRMLPKLTEKVAKGAAGFGGKALLWSAERMGNWGLLTGFGAAMPLTSEQMFHVEQADTPEQKARLREAYTWMNGLTAGPMMLFYELGGGLGRLVGKKLAPEGVAREAISGLGMATLFPGAGELGQVGLEGVADVMAPHMEQFSTMADLFAMQHPGPVKQFLSALGSGDPEKAWEAAQSYAKALQIPAVTFAGLGIFRGIGGKFTTRGKYEEVLAEADREVDRIEGLDGGQKAAVKQHMRETTKDMAPDAAKEKAAEVRREVEEKLGGPEEADRALAEQLLAERVPRPKGQEKRGEGLEARKTELMEARERVSERAAEGDREAERELRALRFEERAIEHLQEAHKAEAPAARIRQEERAERLLEAARGAREGKEVEVPGFRSTPETRKRAATQRLSDEIRTETEIETRGPRAIEAAKPVETREPAPSPEAVQKATKAATSGEILTRAEERILTHPETLPTLPDRVVRRLATRRGMETEGVSGAVLRAGLAAKEGTMTEAQLRAMPLDQLMETAEAAGYGTAARRGAILEESSREAVIKAIVEQREAPEVREVKPASDVPRKPGPKTAVDRIESTETDAERSTGKAAAHEVIQERVEKFVREDPEAGAIAADAPEQVLRALGHGTVYLHSVWKGEQRELIRMEKMAATVRDGIKKDANGLMEFLGTAIGLEGGPGRDMTAVPAKYEKALGHFRKIIYGLKRIGLKETDKEQMERLDRMLVTRHTKDQDKEAWDNPPSELVRAVDALDKFLARFRQPVAERHPAALEMRWVIDEQRADAKRFGTEAEKLEREAEQAWDRVDPDLRAEYMALKEANKRARNKDEKVRQRLIEVTAEINEKAPAEANPFRIYTKLRGLRRNETLAHKRVNRLEKMLQARIDNWGIEENFWPHVPNKPLSEIKEELKKLMGVEPLNPWALWDFLHPVVTGHMKRRTGALEARGERETNPIRALYHYVHRTLPGLEVNNFIAQYWPDIYGKLRRASHGEITRPLPGKMAYLQYWDPRKGGPDARRTVVTRGEFVKLEDGSYAPTSRFSRVDLKRMEEERAMLSAAGIRKKAQSGLQRVVLLDTRLGETREGQLKITKDFQPENPKWMALNKGDFIELPTWRATQNLYRREGGLQLEISDTRWKALMKRMRHLQGGVLDHAIKTNPYVKGVDRFFRGLSMYWGINMIGALSAKSAMSIYVGAYGMIAAVSHPRSAAHVVKNAAAYMGRLGKAKLKNKPNPLEQLASVKQIKLGESTAELFPVAERLRTPKEKLDRIKDPKRRQLVEWRDDAMVDLNNSWIMMGQKTMEFRNLGRTKEFGEPVTRMSGKDYKGTIPAIGYALIDASEFVVRSGHYLYAYEIGRRQGMNRAQARRLAEDVVMATHGVFNQVFKSNAMQTGVGMMVGALTNWFQHAAGVTARRLGIRSSKRRVFLESQLTDPTIPGGPRFQTPYKFFERSSNVRYLTRYFLTAMAVYQIGTMFGADLSRKIGSVISDIPFFGEYFDAWIRGVGRETEDDPEGKEKKPLIRGEIGDIRDVAVETVRQIPFLGKHLASMVKTLGGDFTEHKGGIPIPVLPFTFSGPFESVIKYGASLARASWYGDEEGRERAWKGLKRTLLGSQFSQISKALSTEPTEKPGQYVRRDPDTGDVLQYQDYSGWEGYFLDIWGPRLHESAEWVEKTLSLERKRLDRAIASSQTHRYEGIQRDTMALKRDLLEEGLFTPEMREADRELVERKKAAAKDILARKYGIEGEEFERFWNTRGEGARREDPQDRERFKQAKRYLVSLDERTANEALMKEKLERRERDVVAAARSNKAEGLRQFSRILRDKERPIPKDRAELIWKMMVGKQARTGDRRALNRWGAGVPQEVLDEFNAAIEEAKRRWRQ